MSTTTRSDNSRQTAAEHALCALTPPQARAVELAADGLRDAEVAAAVGVTRQTVNAWRRQHPGFQAALNVRRRELSEAAADRLRALLPKALDALEEGLNGPDAAGVALKVLSMAGVPALLAPQAIGPEDPSLLITARVKQRNDNLWASVLPLSEDGGRGARTAVAAELSSCHRIT